MINSKRALAKAEKQAAEFNAKYPVGTMVKYWRGFKEGEPSGTGEVYHDATVVCYSPVAWIRGCSGCVSITHVEPVEPA